MTLLMGLGRWISSNEEVAVHHQGQLLADFHLMVSDFDLFFPDDLKKEKRIGLSCCFLFQNFSDFLAVTLMMQLRMEDNDDEMHRKKLNGETAGDVSWTWISHLRQQHQCLQQQQQESDLQLNQNRIQ